jgi:hypothetical protein
MQPGCTPRKHKAARRPCGPPSRAPYRSFGVSQVDLHDAAEGKAAREPWPRSAIFGLVITTPRISGASSALTPVAISACMFTARRRERPSGPAIGHANGYKASVQELNAAGSSPSSAAMTLARELTAWSLPSDSASIFTHRVNAPSGQPVAPPTPAPAAEAPVRRTAITLHCPWLPGFHFAMSLWRSKDWPVWAQRSYVLTS